MRNEIRHEALGILIEEELRRAGVNITAMCDAMHMGHTTYSDLRGSDKHLKYYEGILDFYCNALTDEEILEKIEKWALMYLRYRKKKKEELANNDKNCTNGVVELAYDD
ncbi:hypothetical protein SFC43_35290 [Bacteroides sp. CR5/BHMF/2]|nr:hypothetical protein [Bacteroides sp. CR5/BHMF/2]